MKPKFILCLALVLTGGLFGCSTAQHSFESTDPVGYEVDKSLTRQISGVLTECQKIKPGMTRAELLQVFTTEGGLSTTVHQTFAYRKCPYIKVDVDFSLSDPRQKVVEGGLTDTIRKISKPYLNWSVAD